MKFLIKINFIFLICVSCNKEIKLFNKLPKSETGIDFRNDLVENEKFNLIEYLYFYNGGGVATWFINNHL